MDMSEMSAFFTRLSEWLLDPVLWVGFAGTIMHILLVLLLGWILIRIVDRVTSRWTRGLNALPASHPRRQRAHTISNLLSSTARYVVWPVATIMVLSEIGIDIGALIATAGIAGLAIGFGAQTLVKDVISGVFLLFDDSIHAGDLVRVGPDMGTVEHVGIRLIKVRKFDGELMMIPAGELRIFGNRSIGFVRAIVNVSLSYEQNVETVLPIMERVANDWAAANKNILLEEKPSVQAITEFGDSTVNARIAVQVIPGEQFQAERDLRVMLKREFDRLGVEKPFPRRTIYVRNEDTLPPQTIKDNDTLSRTVES